MRLNAQKSLTFGVKAIKNCLWSTDLRNKVYDKHGFSKYTGNHSRLLSNFICKHWHMACSKIIAIFVWGINDFIMTHGLFPIRVALSTRIYCEALTWMTMITLCLTPFCSDLCRKSTFLRKKQGFKKNDLYGR